MNAKQLIVDHFAGDFSPFYRRYLPDLDTSRDTIQTLCPFHTDNEPSLSVRLRGKYAGSFKCFGCGESGDFFRFWGKQHGLDSRTNFKAVLEGLARDFGIQLSGNGRASSRQKYPHATSERAANGKPQAGQRRERQRRTPEEVLQTFRDGLKDSELLTDLKQRRGLSDETIELFEIGRWENSIVFPVRNADGAIIGFKVHKGPHLKPDGTKAKTGEGIKAQLYPLSNLSADTLVIAEGEPDVWRLDTAGVRAITGTAGADTRRDDWAAALKGKDITVVYDADDSGQEAQAKLVKALKGIARRLRYVEWSEGLSKGYDVTDWLQSGKFADLPLKEIKIERVTLPDVKATFRKWLHFDEGGDIILDVVLGGIIANRFSGDPVWLFVVAPPGGSKTETLRAFSEWREVYVLSSLTPSTLISGFVPKDEEDPSLLPKLNGKVLVIKDFTAVLDMNREARQQILGDLRDAYDGSMSKAFGSGAGTRSYKSKFGIIAAVTPVVDRYASIGQQLGERFLKLRLNEAGARERVKRALANSGREADMRSELSRVVEGALLTCDVQDERNIAIGGGVLEHLINLADAVAVLRSDVSRDGYTHVIDYVPVPEVGTRLVKQFAKLARGIAAIRGKIEVGEDEYRLIRRIARDTLPSKRGLIIHAVYQSYHEGFLATQEIADRMDMPTETAKYALEDLRLLKIVGRQGEGKFVWRMSSKFSDRLEALDFFEGAEAISGVEVSEGYMHKDNDDLPV